LTWGRYDCKPIKRCLVKLKFGHIFAFILFVICWVYVTKLMQN